MAKCKVKEINLGVYYNNRGEVMCHFPSGGVNNGKKDSRFTNEKSCGIEVRSNGSRVRLYALCGLLAEWPLHRSLHLRVLVSIFVNVMRLQ